MELSDKIKFIRSSKGWTQEDIAEKLGISTHAYAKIERGETDVNFSRLQQIAEVMEIELPHLLGLNEKNIFNFTGDNNTQFHHWQINSSSIEQTEKYNLIIEQQKKEIDYLKQQVSDLRMIINLQNKPEKPAE
jgi:transcriptional regulator with XRE-family HTH domain